MLSKEDIQALIDYCNELVLRLEAVLRGNQAQKIVIDGRVLSRGELAADIAHAKAERSKWEYLLTHYPKK